MHRQGQGGPRDRRAKHRRCRRGGRFSHQRRAPGRRLHRRPLRPLRRPRRHQTPCPPHRHHRDELSLRAGRLRGAREPRHSAVFRLRTPRGGRHRARLHAVVVCGIRQALRARRADRPHHPLRRPWRHGTAPHSPAYGRLDARDSQGEKKRAQAGLRPRGPLRATLHGQGIYLFERHCLARGDGAALPLYRDPRPARGHCRREGRHGKRPSHGPPDLRRRGLWQNGGGPARCVQGNFRRAAGDGLVPDDHPRPAALHHLFRALCPLRCARRGLEPFSQQGAAKGGSCRFCGRNGERARGHAPLALARRQS